MWMGATASARWIGVADDTIARRGIPWQDEFVPHRVRYKVLDLDPGTEGDRRYYLPDVETLLRHPAPRGGAAKMIPKSSSA